MALKPAIHGRDHIPSGHAVLIEEVAEDDPDVLRVGADPLRVKVNTPTPGGSSSIEWYYVTSTTNWGSGGPTILDFTGPSNGSWDTTDPTFAINANDNIEIAKDGFYMYSIYAVNFGWSGTTVNTIRLEVARLGGETPTGTHGWGTGSYNDIVRYARQWPTPSSIGAHETLFNAMDFFIFSPGSFPGTGPCELSWRATRDEDGTVTADTDPVVHWIIMRLGDEWS